MTVSVENKLPDIDRRVLKENYRNYDLISGFWQDRYRGRVSKLEKKIHEIEGDSVDSVLVSLRQHVDTLTDKNYERRADTLPTENEFKSAFYSVTPVLSDAQNKMLHFHAQKPSRCASIIELQHAGNYRSTTQAMLDYVDIARRFCDELGFMPKSPSAIGKNEINKDYKTILVTVKTSEKHGAELWVMRPHIVRMVTQS